MKTALRPILLLAVLLASSLAFAAQASAGTGALSVTDEIALGGVDRNSTHELTVRIDNSDGDEAVSGALDVHYVQIQAYTDEERLAIQDWITGPDWSVGAGEVVEETWTLTVPEDASPGPYTLAMAFTRHDYDDSGNQTAGAEVAATTLVKFTVRGVVWSGHFSLPDPMENFTSAGVKTLVLRNYDTIDYVGGFIHVQDGHHASSPIQPKKTTTYWPNQTIPAGGEASYAFDFKVGGRGWASSLLWAEYWPLGDPQATATTRVANHTVTVIDLLPGGGGGSAPFEYATPTLGTHDNGALAARDSATHIPQDTPWWLAIAVNNTRYRAMSLTLDLQLDGEILLSVTDTVPAAGTQEFRFLADGLVPGTYPLSLRDGGRTVWMGRLVVETPDVAAYPPSWEQGSIGLGVENAGVGAQVCHTFTVTDMSGSPTSIAPQTECRFLSKGESWDLDRVPDLEGLPPGEYLLHVQTTWDGQGETVQWDIPITVEADGTVMRGDPAAATPPSSTRAGAGDGPRSVVLWLYLVGTAFSVAVMLGLITARRGAGNKGQKLPF